MMQVPHFFGLSQTCILPGSNFHTGGPCRALLALDPWARGDVRCTCMRWRSLIVGIRACFAQNCKTKRSSISTNEMREVERGSESNSRASQNSRCSACRTLPHPFTKPATRHALPASRHADMAPKESYRALGLAWLCHATLTFVQSLKSRVLALSEFIILLVITL
jgi:hypothetical protein